MPSQWVVPTDTRPSGSLLRAAVGVPICAALAYGSAQLIGRAWDACGDAEPPYLLGLLVLYLPGIAIGQWIVWTIVVFFTRKRAWWVGLLIGLAIAVLIGWAAVAVSVPMRSADEYASDAQPDQAGEVFLLDTCRPDGLPTWWPTWLPL